MSKEIQLLKDAPTSIIRLPQTIRDKNKYFKDYIADLEKLVNDLNKKLSEYKYIDEYLTLECPKRIGKKINIIECSQTLKSNNCKECFNRKNLLIKITK